MSRSLLITVVAMCVSGCGGGLMPEAAFDSARSLDSSKSMSRGQTVAGNFLGAETDGVTADAPSSATTAALEAGAVATQTPPPSGAAVDRKIIYTATLDLVVKDLPKVDGEIKRLMKSSGGYVAEYREERIYGDQLQGHWVVRIPSDYFYEFLDAVTGLGVPESQQIDAQEVTEEFVDLTARLDNKKRTEAQYQKLLEEHAGKVEDIVKIATQLDSVREEIERLEGRLRFLNDRIAMTTITITAREQKDYKPPQAPTFGIQIQETFGSSITNMVLFGQGIVLVAVAVIPWLGVLFVLFIPCFVLLRRWRRRRTQGIAA